MSRDVWLVDATGRREPDTLAAQIGSVGSQGTVWTLRDRPGLVAKIVHRAQSGDLAHRIAVMLREPADWTMRGGRPAVAWPVAAVRHRTRDRLLGYAAPKLAQPQFAPLPLLFNPSARRRMLPTATWAWWLTAAEDLARTVHAAHQRGHVIGDLAPANLFASATGAVCLIDADGWQLRDPAGGSDLPCPFSRPEYTAPEDLGQSSHRDRAGDGWALAVLVAQLISLGFHPYGGVPRNADGPIDEADNVRARRCRVLGADVRTPAAAPPAAVVSGVLHDRLAEALDAGYDRPERRPGPLAWAAALAFTRRRLVRCRASAAHVHAPEHSDCPWCAMVAAGCRDPFPAGVGSDGPR